MLERKGVQDLKENCVFPIQCYSKTVKIAVIHISYCAVQICALQHALNENFLNMIWLRFFFIILHPHMRS